MNLWIRSQRRQNLMKANDIVVKYNKILVFKEDDTPTVVGEYESKERALEVLDEIQNIIIMQQLSEMDSQKFFQSMPKDTKNIKIVIDCMSVYEMPQR